MLMPEFCNITYKKCTCSHAQFLLSISTTTYLENYAYLWEDEGNSYLERFYSKASILTELNKSAVNFFLVYVEGTVAGYYKTKFVEVADQGKIFLELDKLYLLNDFIGKQLGKQILAHIERKAISQGHNEVSLSVMDSSPAKFFYLNNGYQLTTETKLTYPFMKQQYTMLLTLKKRL